MQKKIMYLCFCLVCFLNTAVQAQNAATKLLDSIINLTERLKKDTSINNPCKKNISNFSDKLPGLHTDPTDETNKKKFVRDGTDFTKSFTDTNAQKCSNEKIESLIKLTTRLINMLNVLTKPDDSAAAKVPGVKESKNEGDWKLDIDSLSNSISNSIDQIVIKDSLGYLEVSLLYNDTNAIKTKVNGSKLKPIIGQNRLTIQLPKEKESRASSALQSPDLIAQQLKTFNTENKSLLISVFLLFFMIVAGVWLYIRAYKKFSLLLTTAPILSSESKTNYPMEQIKTDPQPSIPVISPIVEELTPVVQEVNEKSPAVVSDTNGYFICEVMMTAGPRKKPMSEPNSDKDLGEDVCGFISDPNSAFVWLLDGTSDDDPLRNPVTNREYFSARLLAQSIGDRLRNKFMSTQRNSLSEMIQQAIEEVKVNWLRTIDTLPVEEKTSLKNKINNKNFPHCSTTALIAQLQKSGSLNAYRVGDSKMLIFSVSPGNEWNCVETSLAENNENGVDRIFFRLELTDDENFDIVSNGRLEYDTAEVNNIHTMICFSDGISIETEQTLKQEYKTDPVKTKREIIYEVQGTRDDKSICFVELMKKVVANG